MKYLNNRQKFLNKNLKPINEVLGNEIKWGDSLVGRLINSFRRKIGVGTNLVRIDNCIKSLKSHFEDIIFYSKSNSLTDEDKLKIIKVIVYQFIFDLDRAIQKSENAGFAGEEEKTDSGDKKVTKIEDKNYLSEIESMILDIIDSINQLDSKGFNFDNKDALIPVLKELLEKIKTMKSELEKKPSTSDNQNDDKKFEVGKYYVYNNKEGKSVIIYVTKIDNDITSAISFNDISKKWNTNTLTMLKTEKIISEISIDGDILNNDDLQKNGIKIKDVPIYKVSSLPTTPIQNKTNQNTSQTTGVIKDSFISNYSKFIIENQVNQNNNQSVNFETQKTLLSEFWLNLFNTKISKLILTEQEANKLKSEVDGISLEDKEDDSITIFGGKDPIIGILKMFNRAYKLHTTQVIPSGRSGGKVSNQTFREYTCFGSGTPENAGNSGGPYRNNSVFDKWERGVFDIIEDRKYQPIFHKKTKLQVGDKIREEAGPIIKKMIIDLLDGETLYKGEGGYGKSQEGGAQKAFLDKYFDFDGIKSDELALDGEKEMTIISNNADAIKEEELSFEKAKDVNFVIENPNNIIIKVENKSTEKDQPKTIYFYAQESYSNDIYLACFDRAFGYIKEAIQKKGEDTKVSYKLGNLSSQNKSKFILGTKMSKEVFTKLVNGGTTINLKVKNYTNTTSPDEEKEVIIGEVTFLKNKTNENKFFREELKGEIGKDKLNLENAPQSTAK